MSQKGSCVGCFKRNLRGWQHYCLTLRVGGEEIIRLGVALLLGEEQIIEVRTARIYSERINFLTIIVLPDFIDAKYTPACKSCRSIVAVDSAVKSMRPSTSVIVIVEGTEDV